MDTYHLDLTKIELKGPSQELIIVNNQWAAVALNKFHSGSKAEILFEIDGEEKKALLEWESGFINTAMKEEKDMANHGGVAMAWFVMSVLQGFKYVEQTHIGDGVDYLFKIDEPNDDDLNFLNESHYVEISGILKESGTNTLANRIKNKHKQIKRGSISTNSSSVIVTLFSQPKTVKQKHL